MKELSQKEVLEFCILNKISFAICRLPGSRESKLIIANNVEEISFVEELSEKNNGFIISPFSKRNGHVAVFLPAYCIVSKTLSYDKVLSFKSEVTLDKTGRDEIHYADYNSYKSQFKHLYQYIENGEIKKAILSRVKHLFEISENKAASFYYLLSEKYPNAYTFMYYTPQTGLWTGASPELLLELKDHQARTVSLAGTLNELDPKLEWRNKELDEQQIVTNYITGVLKKYNVGNPVIKGPETVKAGKVSHLKTFYEFNANLIEDKIWNFIQDLHPTPAVCGLPKDKAMKCVLKSEKHDRSYYAGYLGYVNNEELSLFVNIRSMKFVEDGVDLYLGGGITIGSVAEEEWNETELKSTTLQEAINELIATNTKEFNQES